MQTEKAGLSRKEKRLLAAAAVLGLFYLAFQFGFLPQYNEHREKTERYAELSEERRTVAERLNSEAEVMERYQNAKEAYREIEEPFRRTDTSTDLSRMLTELCVRNGLSVSSQSLGARDDFHVPREDGGRPAGESAFSTVTTSMAVNGSYEAVKRLLDEVESEQFISISRISFAPALYGAEGESDQVTITFVVILLNGLDENVNGS